MSSSYKPFLIANFRTGLELDLEPWLLPQDAFKEMKNAYLDNGVITKRNGYTEFADTGAATSIQGILNYQESNGTKSLIVTDEDRTYEYASGTLTDLDSTDIWTGTGNNLVSSVNWNGVLYMTNGKDQIRTFDGSVTADFDIDTDGDTNNDITTCKFITQHKERIIIFYTLEGGVSYPRRARWHIAGNPADWTNDGYIDCPTSDFITGAVLIGDDILVWFSGSVWWLKYTADYSLPFRWERIDNEAGNSAPFFPVVRKNKSFGFDKAGIVVTDGFEVQPIDGKIPNFGLTFNQQAVDRCYGIVVEEYKQVWLAYPTDEASTNDSVLIFNYEDGSWSTFEMDFVCFGFFTRQSTLTIDEITWTFDEWAEPFDSMAAQVGFPTIIGGKTNGKLYTLNDGTSDDGEAIEMVLHSKCWNPYKEQGLKARLGYIDFLVSCSETDELSVDFFLDFSPSSYMTKTLSFDHAGDKAWVRIFSGAVGNSHSIRISHNVTGQKPRLHAIMPWLKPAGRLIL